MTIKAEYIDHMGSDARVVDAARVSFDKESTEYSEEKNSRLINFLAKHGHFTPFTHPQITLRETVPIFVARQRFKHVVGFTYNEISRRYVDEQPKLFTPEDWRYRPDGSVKQGSGEVIQDDGAIYEEVKDTYTKALDTYRWMIDKGCAPEQARMVLPQSMLTSYYVTGSLAAFARACKLRDDGHAQVEIQRLAKQWDEIISPLFPVSWRALTS